MTSPLRLLVPIAIVLAAAGALVGRGVLSIGDEAVGHATNAEKRLADEPFSLRGAWRDIGHLRQAMPAIAPIESAPIVDARQPDLAAVLSPERAQPLPGDKHAREPSEKPNFVASAAARPWLGGTDREAAADGQAEAAPDVAQATLDGPRPVRSAGPIGGSRMRDDASPGAPGLTARSPASDAATSALVERDTVRPIAMGHVDPSARAAISPAKTTQPSRRAATGYRSVDQSDALLAFSLFRDIHYAMP